MDVQDPCEVACRDSGGKPDNAQHEALGPVTPSSRLMRLEVFCSAWATRHNARMNVRRSSSGHGASVAAPPGLLSPHSGAIAQLV